MGRNSAQYQDTCQFRVWERTSRASIAVCYACIYCSRGNQKSTGNIKAISQVKRSLMEKMRNNSTLENSARPAQFEDLFVQRHINVSILYADIVNFTPLSETLSAHQLVATLNQLFCKFDQIAQEKQCMRIKILGDCYYCVSGLPVSRPNHAINIVSMGLAMIDAIR